MGQGCYMVVGYGWVDAASFVKRDRFGYAKDKALSAIIDDGPNDGFRSAYESKQSWLAVPLLDMSGTFDGGANVSGNRTAFALDDLEAQIERLNPGGLERARSLCAQVLALCPSAPPPKLILILDYD